MKLERRIFIQNYKVINFLYGLSYLRNYRIYIFVLKQNL